MAATLRVAIDKIVDFVDLPRIELGTVQCECTGIPLTYKPPSFAHKITVTFGL